MISERSREGTEFSERLGAAPDAASPLDIRHVLIDEQPRNGHPSAANGVHEVARHLVLEQLHAGDRARVVYLPAGNSHNAPSGVLVQTVPNARTKFARGLLLRVGATDEILRDVDSSTVFHIHGFRQPMLVPLTRAFKRYGVPYVITGHSRFAHVFDRSGRLRHLRTAAYVALFERHVLNGAKFVQALSQFEAREIGRLAPGARVCIVPNGVFSSALEGAPPRLATRIPSAQFPVFGFIGRFAIEHKGLDLLFDGFARYRQLGGTGRLEICGTGDDARQKLITLCRSLHLENVVSIKGPYFGADKEVLLRSWDYFVLPSRFDRMPLAALEAALLGVPLIITPEAGVLPDGGVLPILALTPAAVALAMKHAENMPLEQWVHMSGNAHRLVVQNSDWTSVAARLRELYSEARLQKR